MSEIVDRVTEAICQAERDWLESDRSVSLQQATAVAAIKALREPTVPMLVVGCMALMGEPSLKDIWHPMIDEALK